MSPVPLVVAVAAGITGAVLLVVPAVSPGSLPVRASGSAAVPLSVREAPGVGAATGLPAAPVVPAAPFATGRHAPAESFRWPLSPAPRVLRRFVVGPHPWSPGHRGVDLAAGPGQHVLAAGAGTVAFAGVVAGRGVITIAHPGGLRTTYEPVTADVAVGQAVAVGDPLGVLATGSHCPTSCLHWGALRGDVYLDPLELLRPPAPPILLPLGAGSG